jgi:hypothetical protein
MARCHSRPVAAAKNTAKMAVPQKRNDLHFLTTSTFRRTQIFKSKLFKREFVAGAPFMTSDAWFVVSA